jgi:hypothetical protein
MATIIQYMTDPKPAETKRTIDTNLVSMAIGDIIVRDEVFYRVFMVAPLGPDIYVYCDPVNVDYTTRQSFKPGDRVELCPSLDLWMRGAKFAIVQRICKRTGVVVARSEHKSVRNLIRLSPDRFRHVK